MSSAKTVAQKPCGSLRPAVSQASSADTGALMASGNITKTAPTRIDSGTTRRVFVENLMSRSWLTTADQPRFSRLGA
jgi:hypothetical protein